MSEEIMSRNGAAVRVPSQESRGNHANLTFIGGHAIAAGGEEKRSPVGGQTQAKKYRRKQKDTKSELRKLRHLRRRAKGADASHGDREDQRIRFTFLKLFSTGGDESRFLRLLP